MRRVKNLCVNLYKSLDKFPVGVYIARVRSAAGRNTIQEADMKKNHKKHFYPKEIRWVYNINPDKFGRGIWYVRFIRKIKACIRNSR